MTKHLIALIIIATSNIYTKIYAQEIEDSTVTNSTLNIGADLTTRYIWRGLNFSKNTAAIQPSIEYYFKGLSIGTWGSYSLGEVGTQEVDIYASFTFLNNKLTFGLTDYFFPDEINSNPVKYFSYENPQTGHVFEASLQYNGTEKLPLTLLVATNFYGNDKELKNNNNNNYSTYLELGYSFKIANIDANAFVGGVLSESNYYATKKAEATNVGLSFKKEIALTQNYVTKINSTFIFNPNTEQVFLVFILSI